MSGGGGGHLAGGQGRPRGTRRILSGCPLKPRQPKNLKNNPRANKSFLFIAKNIAKSPVNKKMASSKMRSSRDQDIPSYKIAFPPHRLDTYYPHKFTACELFLSPSPFVKCLQGEFLRGSCLQQKNKFLMDIEVTYMAKNFQNLKQTLKDYL